MVVEQSVWFVVIFISRNIMERKGGEVKFNGVARVRRKQLINERNGKSRMYLVI